jgi:hypothetical protein
MLAVAARELAERWILLPASLVVGFFPLVVPAFAFGFRREDAPFVGIVGAVGMGAAAAVVIGSSMLARDAADGRLGFLFSRPLPWGTIWGGKWLAAVVLVASSAILEAIPWMAVYPLASLGGHHGNSWLRAILEGPGVGHLFVLIVLGIGLANLGATAFRSRSKWLALDFALLLAAFWTTRHYVAPLWLYEIVGKGPSEVTLVLVPLAVSVVVGSVAQVAVGRTDLRRAHRAMSLGFWAVVTLTLAAASGYWLWARSAGPDAVRVQSVSRDPAGRWIYVEGTGEHSGWYPHGLLIDTTTGRHLERPEPEEGFDRRLPFGMLFSADGGFGALPGTVRGGAALQLFDLREAQPRVSEVALESSPPPTWKTSFALAPQAASVFVVHESGASLFALPSGRRIATTTIAPGWRPAAVRYVAEGAARAWLVPDGPRARAEMRVVDLAADGASSGTTFPIGAALDPVVGWRSVLPDADGRRILTSDAGLHLRDGASGQPLASLAEGPGPIPALFLADGRIVVEGRAGAGQPPLEHARLWAFDRVGTRLADIELTLPAWGLGLGPEAAPGRVVVSCVRGASADTLLVDVASGAVVEKLTGLRPAFAFPVLSSAAPAAGSSVHFFREDDGRGAVQPDVRPDRVVRIDFATGERRVVAGPGAAAGERISAR